MGLFTGRQMAPTNGPECLGPTLPPRPGFSDNGDGARRQGEERGVSVVARQRICERRWRRAEYTSTFSGGNALGPA